MNNETLLINATLAGKEGYEQLVERYHVGLIIHCERLVNNRQDAEDIAQESFVKAYLKLKDFDETQGRFSTWLYRIATNNTIDFLRKQKRKVDVDDIEAIAEVTMPTHIEDEEKAQLQKAVLSLMPPEYRLAVDAYYWKGRSYQEIAYDLGVPINTVRTWLRRAKAQLREELS